MKEINEKIENYLSDKDDKPKILTNINLNNLKRICSKYIDDLANEKYVRDDSDHYIFEVAMETLYGKDVWKWINSHME